MFYEKDRDNILKFKWNLVTGIIIPYTQNLLIYNSNYDCDSK